MTTQLAQQINSVLSFATGEIAGPICDEAISLQYCEVFEALGHGTRFKVFNFIYRAGLKGVRPKDIIEQFGVDSGTLDFHLKKLLVAGLIVAKEHGQRGTYRSNQSLPMDLVFLFDSINQNPKAISIT
jgi:predicted transcriptional regulator